jgi:hypothetical protein
MGLRWGRRRIAILEGMRSLVVLLLDPYPQTRLELVPDKRLFNLAGLFSQDEGNRKMQSYAPRPSAMDLGDARGGGVQ